MRSMFSVAALGMALACGSAIQAAAPAVQLRHQHQVGDKWTRSSTVNMAMVLSAAGNVADGTVNAEGTENLAVAGKAADGAWELTRKGTSVAHINGIPNAPAESKEELAECRFTQDALGKVSSVQVPAPEVNQQALMNASKLVRYASEQVAPLDVFPEKAVSVGDTWTATHMVKGADGREQKIEVRYKLFAYTESSGEAWIQRASKVPIDLQFGADLANFKMNGAIDVDELFLFNNKTGKAVRGSSTLNGDFSMSFEIGGNKIDVAVHQSGAGTMTEQ